MKFQPTTEQQEVIATALTGQSMVIRAFAGAAKTTTCEFVAEAVLKPSLYVSFNKDIATEAATRFPSHVTCKTMHSIAYAAIVRFSKSTYGKRLQGYYDFNDIIAPLMPPEASLKFKIQVVDHIKAFCQSKFMVLEDYLNSFKEKPSKMLCNTVESYWNELSSETSDVKITHDIYLKLYQLSSPVLNYEVIYLDEAQDTNPVVASIIAMQRHAQIIRVGDSYQSIYEWRGAVNAMAKTPKGYKEVYLTESFRFTQEIADIASKLTYIAGNEIPVIGRAMKIELPNKATKATLCRTNGSIISYLLDAEAKNQKVCVLADLTDLWSKVYHINSLYFKERPKYPCKELDQYSTYKELTEAAEDLPELKKLINVTYTLSQNVGVYKNIQKIKSIIVEKGKEDFTLATIHKSKGLEWDEVTLDNDIIYLKEDQQIIDALMDNQTLNLMYVGVTRAKQKINLPELVNYVVTDWNWFKQEARARGYTV